MKITVKSYFDEAYYTENLRGKAAESVDELGIDKYGRYYHKGSSHGSRCTLIYKLNGKGQEPLRAGGIDCVHVMYVIVDALKKRHSEIDSHRASDLIHSYMNAHQSDLFGGKYTASALKEILPKAVPGLEVVDVQTGKRAESVDG